MSIFSSLIALSKRAILGLEFVTPVVDLAARLWLASVFWKSGLTKVTSWDSTLSLFNYVYHVPLLPPDVAAVLSAGVELGGAALLALGLGARVGATALFVLNFVAVISYPDLSDAGRMDHFFWGLLLLIILVHGAGKLSADHFIRKAFFRGGANRTLAPHP